MIKTDDLVMYADSARDEMWITYHYNSAGDLVSQDREYDVIYTDGERLNSKGDPDRSVYRYLIRQLCAGGLPENPKCSSEHTLYQEMRNNDTGLGNDSP